MHRTLSLGLALMILTSCSSQIKTPGTASPQDFDQGSISVPIAPPLTETPIPIPAAERTPPTLPEVFVSPYLDPLDTPQTYIQDNCEYIRNKWDPNKAAPGTVVLIIMLNSINRGSKPNSSDSITVNQFERLIQNFIEQGFEAINTQQLAGFLETNSSIPMRSVLLLQDGRHTAENFERHFRVYWEQRSWPVVNGWIIHENTPEGLWLDNLALEQEGFVDHQLYSPLARYSTNASEEYLSDELSKFVGIFENRYHKAPITIIWPGVPGHNFPKAARENGFRLGFTQNARGPIMYNWIPQAEVKDPHRPAYYPERSFDDPLMTLPRYWPLQVIDILDQVRLTGRAAAEFAEQNRQTELDYYSIQCTPEYGPIPE